jgi:hypothetical protein
VKKLFRLFNPYLIDVALKASRLLGVVVVALQTPSCKLFKVT